MLVLIGLSDTRDRIWSLLNARREELLSLSSSSPRIFELASAALLSLHTFPRLMTNPPHNLLHAPLLAETGRIAFPDLSRRIVRSNYTLLGTWRGAGSDLTCHVTDTFAPVFPPQLSSFLVSPVPQLAPSPALVSWTRPLSRA